MRSGATAVLDHMRLMDILLDIDGIIVEHKYVLVANLGADNS